MMQNYPITEEFVLPSHGKVYPGKQVNDHITLRSMTAVDEMKRLRPGDRAFKNMAEVIDSCIVNEEGLGISSYDLCIGDYQFLLHKLRIVTYGSDYPIQCTCPYCLMKQDETLNLDDLSYKDFDESILSENEFDLPVTGKHIVLRMQTPRLQDDIDVAVKSDKKKNRGDSSGSAFFYTLKYIIESVDGDRLDSIQMNDFISALPMKDVNFIYKKAERVVDMMGFDSDITIVCNTCGLTYTTPFRITSEFFGPSI